MPTPPAVARPRWVSHLVLAALLLLAFATGYTTTHDLDWPGASSGGVGIDLYRDIALAQTMLDSGYGPDPNYLGERSWYNPLVPGMTALVSLVSGSPVPRVAARLGAYVNLAAPLAFYLMAASLLGRWRALSAVAAFLFLTSSTVPSWVSATYSPWLMPVNFAQSLFYVTVWAYVRARRRGGRGGYALTGCLWGVTFLAHAAPALVFGLVVLAATAVDVRRRDGARVAARPALGRACTMIALAAAVSTPLLVTILGHYHLRTIHRQPAMYTEPLLGRELPTLLWLHVTLPMLLVGIGALALWRRGPSPLRLIVGAWLAAAGLLLAYGYVVMAARLLGDVLLPSLVPSIHFFFYVKAALPLLFAVGLGAVADRASRLGAGPRWSADAWADALGLALLLLGAPTYLARPDFAESRQDALDTSNSDQVRAALWLREHAEPWSVALASNYDAAVIPGPAGVKVVAAFNAYSNPYVDWDVRAQARNQLYAALDAGNDEEFARVADRYAVRYVIARDKRGAAYQANPASPLVQVFQAGEIRIFRRP